MNFIWKHDLFHPDVLEVVKWPCLALYCSYAKYLSSLLYTVCGKFRSLQLCALQIFDEPGGKIIKDSGHLEVSWKASCIFLLPFLLCCVCWDGNGNYPVYSLLPFSMIIDYVNTWNLMCKEKKPLILECFMKMDYSNRRFFSAHLCCY